MGSVKANIRKLYLYKFLVSLMFIGGFWVPFYTTIGNITFFQIMILEAIFIMGVFLFEVPTGAVADYFGRKTSLLISTFVNLFAVLIYALYPTFWMFLIGDILWALSIALYSGAADAMVYDSLAATKSKVPSKTVFGRFHSFEGLGHLVAGPIGGFLVASSGMRWTMGYTLIPFAVAFLLTFTLREPRHKQKKSRSYLSTVTEGMQYFRTHRVLKIFAFDKISIDALGYAMFWFYQLLLIDKGVPLVYFGLFYSAFFGSPILFLNSLGFLERVFRGRRSYLFWSASIASLLMLLLGVVESVVFMTVALMIFSGLIASRDSLFVNYMNKHIPTSLRATVMSTMSMVWAVVNAVLFLVMGKLVEWSLSGTMIVLGSVGIVCSLVSRVKEEHLLD